jgi:hypothetical protein
MIGGEPLSLGFCLSPDRSSDMLPPIANKLPSGDGGNRDETFLQLFSVAKARHYVMEFCRGGTANPSDVDRVAVDEVRLS